MKYIINRTEAGFEMAVHCELGDPLFEGEFGLTGRLTLTEPQEALEAAYKAARNVLVLNSPKMEKRRSQT